MKWFKFTWFNSKDRKALRKASKSLQEISTDVKSIDKTVGEISATLATKQIPKAPVYGKPYTNIIYSAGNVTVVFPDGTVLDKVNVDKQFFDKIRNCNTQVDIENLMIDTSVPPPPPQNEDHKYETQEERQMVTDNLDVIRNHKDFVVCGDVVTLKGVNLPIPAIILASFIEILEKQESVAEAMRVGKENYDFLVTDEEALFEQYRALKMFWLKLALNPLAKSREDLLVFCRKNDVRITTNGNLILYRRIVSKSGADTKYVAFVSQSYYSLKRRGQDTRQYAIGKRADGSYYYVNLDTEQFNPDELIGNLHVLYYELPDFENNTYTAYWDNKVTIKIGGIYSIPDDKINLNNSICAAGGLHAACVNYNYSGYGDVPVVVLVNPSKAITVPLGETGKLRTTEMFVACVNHKPQGEHFDDSALSAFDDEYHDLTLAQLEEAANTKSFAGISIQQETPNISLVELANIKDMLKGRIKPIV